MVAYSFYESDSRVMRYAGALVERGDDVEVFALNRNGDLPRAECLAGVQLHRVQERRRDERGKFSYLVRVMRFLAAASVALTRRHLRAPYDLVHVHNVPDFLVFAAWLPKLTGAALVLDIHDILPEFFASKFGAGERSSVVGLLRKVERFSCRFADHVIISNHLWQERLVSRSIPADRCSVFINHVDRATFHPRPRTRADGRFVVLYPGGLQHHQGLDLVIQAMAELKGRAPGLEFQIYGEGPERAALEHLTRHLGIAELVRFHDALPAREVPGVMADADLGIVAKRADSFGNEAYSTKIMEFMAVGVPVLVSATKIDQYYFRDGEVQFFRSGDVSDLATQLLALVNDPERRRVMAARAMAYAERHSWETRQADYLALVDRLSPVPKGD